MVSERLSIVRVTIESHELIAIYKEETALDLVIEIDHRESPLMVADCFEYSSPDDLPDEVVSAYMAGEVLGSDRAHVEIIVDNELYLDYLEKRLKRDGMVPETAKRDRVKWLPVCDETQTVIQTFDLEMQWSVVP